MTNSKSVDTNDRASHSSSEKLHYVIQPEDFLKLKSGGEDNNYKVQTIMVIRGKEWKTGEPFREVTFDQRGKKPSFLQFILQTLKSIFQ